MNKIFLLLGFLSLSVAFATVGCGTTAKPTTAPTLTPQIITVIVTATPAVSPTPELTMTPTTTLTTTALITATQTVTGSKLTTTPGKAIPTAIRRTATPKPAASTATSTPLPLKYGAVKLQRPIYEGPNPGDQRDERHYPSDSLSFEWLANSSLGSGECYEVRSDMKSNADGSTVGDAFIQCDPVETQKASGLTVRFILNKPAGPGPTYAALIPSGAGDLTVIWSVTIVKDDGVISTGGAYATDGTRHKVSPLSPRSNIVSFPLKGNNTS